MILSASLTKGSLTKKCIPGQCLIQYVSSPSQYPKPPTNNGENSANFTELEHASEGMTHIVQSEPDSQVERDDETYKANLSKKRHTRIFCHAHPSAQHVLACLINEVIYHGH